MQDNGFIGLMFILCREYCGVEDKQEVIFVCTKLLKESKRILQQPMKYMILVFVSKYKLKETLVIVCYYVTPIIGL